MARDAEPGATQTLVQEGTSYKLRSQKIAIEITEGPEKGDRRIMPGPNVLIGSGKGCDFELSDPTVSRQHLTLSIDGTGLRVLDAGSRNATYLDGVRVRDAYAQPGSTLKLGKTTLTLRLSTETITLPLSRRRHFGGLVGSSVPMRLLYTVIEQVAPTAATVLIEGETGTGKELVAEALHEESQRSEEPFVVFDCSSTAPNLIESELFGHRRGAFTGANSDRIGSFQSADGGTLFLDEIGELPLDLQPKLLRAIEGREVRPLGASSPVHADVRIVAATNRSLAAEVEAGRFREDLYYRLAVVKVLVPPLRDRLEDIPQLVAHFEKELAQRGDLRKLSDQVVRSYQTQRWAGNVRELRNAIELAMTLGQEIPALPSVPQGPTAAPDFSTSLADAQDQLVRNHVLAALKATSGNATAAADLLKTNRKFIQRAIKRYRLRDYLNS